MLQLKLHEHLHSSHDVADKLLGLIHIILAQKTLAASLPDAVVFLRDVFHLLVAYSTEGNKNYLTIKLCIQSFLIHRLPLGHAQ